MNQSPIMVPISPGELVDKLTILEIKQQRILDTRQRHHLKPFHGPAHAFAIRGGLGMIRYCEKISAE